METDQKIDLLTDQTSCHVAFDGGYCYGYGPFRWVVLSGKPEDLALTDQTAMDCIDKDRRFQDYDNYLWIKHAGENNLVIGTQARILYQDGETRKKIALAFNRLVREGKTGPIMMGRDHMDTGGVDAPSRETSNIHDGSNITADMSALVYGGDAAMGMTMMTMHNGGGTGIGNSQSCGYGLLLDGSPEVDEIICRAVNYDVMCGVARRAWAGNLHTLETVSLYQEPGNTLTGMWIFLSIRLLLPVKAGSFSLSVLLIPT